MSSVNFLITFVLVLELLSGCATIMGTDTHSIPINSVPSSAVISITDEKGVEVFSGKTPTTVTLKKSDGSYCATMPSSAKITSQNNKATDGSITIMLIKQVPVHLRSKMKLIN